MDGVAERYGPWPGQANYAASLASVQSLAEALTVELKPVDMDVLA
jgi:short-subunit dehydrogenase